jgi:Fe-S cluster assembly protein SufD
MTTTTNVAPPADERAPEYPTETYSRALVEQRSRERGEPEWLAALRLTAWDAFAALPMPNERERAWKYFDPKRLRLDGKTGQPTATGSERAVTKIGERSALVVEEDGAVTRVELADDVRAQGVTVASLADAVREQEALVQKHLATAVPPDEGKFPALNAAFMADGVFIHVPKDVHVSLPVQVAFVQRTPESIHFPRLLVVLERGAKLTLLEERIGAGDTGGFCAGVTEFILGDEAELQHYAVQRWGSRMQDVTTQRALLGKDARSTTLTAGLGGELQKWWVEAKMQGSGSESKMLGVFFGGGRQHLDVITLQDHIGAHTTSDLLYKSALKDRAVGAYYGLTRVGPEARGTAANQEDRNLLLSPKAKADADPVLEIMTSDVIRCGHGASAGPVDEEQLFYLECRGLPRSEAEKLLVQGFLHQVMDRIPVPALVETIEREIAAKLGAGAS